MPVRDDQQMDRRLWVEVVERRDMFVSVDHLSRNVSGHDFAEDAV